MSAPPGLRITVVAEDGSWVVPYAETLATTLRAEGHDATVAPNYDEIPAENDIAFLLSCTRIAGPAVLAKSVHTLVVHQSDLPHGRGWSPLAWQVVAGENEIPVCIFEAVEGLDEGPIYYRDLIRFDGHELVDELRAAQAASAVKLCTEFVRDYPHARAEPQRGKPTYYRRRTADDSRLDPSRPLDEQFDLLRICDNERYPAYFDLRGHTYELRIAKRSPGGEPSPERTTSQAEPSPVVD